MKPSVMPTSDHTLTACVPEAFSEDQILSTVESLGASSPSRPWCLRRCGSSHALVVRRCPIEPTHVHVTMDRT